MRQLFPLLVAAILLGCGSKDPPAACLDRCGNGSCEEMVCMGSGCPCAETAESCAQDCAKTP
jgi:hypothetical protein